MLKPLITVMVALVPLPAAAQGKPSGLPEGAGKERVEALCMRCHQAREILNSSGYTREGWKELIGTMLNLSEAPDEEERITRYLATHFPPNLRRAPKLVPGSERIAFKEWRTPTPGARSRDPVQAADGSIWYAGQWSNQVGRIDPATGEIKEYALPANAPPAEEFKQVSWVVSQDPDVIMVGLVEDPRSAQELLKHASTGKRVYVGLRAGSTFDALTMWRKMIARSPAAVKSRRPCLSSVMPFEPGLKFTPSTSGNFFRSPANPLCSRKIETLPSGIHL